MASWFDEQIKLRKQLDDKNLSDALDTTVEAIMGSSSSGKYNGFSSAIDEVLVHFGYKVNTNEDKEKTELSFEDELDEKMRSLEISRREVKLEGNWYKDAFGPMIGMTKKGQHIALIPNKFFGYSYLDPETNTRIKLNKKTKENLESDAICFYKPLPLKSLTIADLLSFMIKQLTVADFVLYFTLMGLSTLLGLISPLFTKWLFGSVLDSKNLSVLLALTCFIVFYTLSNSLFSSYQFLINQRIGIKQNVAVEAAVMNRMLNLPAKFFKEYSSGELSQRCGYVRSLCSTLFNSIALTGITSLFSLAYIGQIFLFAKELVIPSLFVTVVNLGFSLFTTFRQMKIQKSIMETSAKTGGLSYAIMTGIQKIKLSGSEKRIFSRWAKEYAKEAKMAYNPPTFIKLNSTISSALSFAGTLLIYYVAIKNKIGVADYYGFTASYAMVSGAIASVASITTTIAGIRPTLEMAKPIMETCPEVSEGKILIKDLKGEIEFNHVSFRYTEDTPYVIDDLSLKIKPKEYIAIVGSTGCGKSTLLRLLLGFEKPNKGTIFFDHKDSQKINMRSLRHKAVGVVLQDGKLFSGDIFSNITISAPELKMEDAWRAAEIASIADDIRKMPMGMHTLISEGQGGISGGQRQRLMIARAVAPSPSILMFDEATSALDNITQKSISEAIDKLNCTRIVIAHRLSTIKHADRIVFLEKGKIVEDGTYDELIALNGHFAKLVERQRIDSNIKD